MDIQSFYMSFLNVVCEMAPYLLLGFFIAGVLHVFVPQSRESVTHSKAKFSKRFPSFSWSFRK